MVWEFIQSNPVALSQIALSFALVVVTGIYTYHTVKQTSEMEQTREMENQPVVKGGIAAPFPNHLCVVVQNTGNAVAHTVYAKMYFKDIEEGPKEFCFIENAVREYDHSVSASFLMLLSANMRTISRN